MVALIDFVAESDPLSLSPFLPVLHCTLYIVVDQAGKALEKIDCPEKFSHVSVNIRWTA